MLQTRNGGKIQIGGTLDNTGRDLAYEGDGTLELSGGTIRGGSLAEGIMLNATSGTLVGVTLYGDMHVMGTVTIAATA